MAKKIVKQLKLQVPGGKAVPNQQIAPALGQAGISVGEFVKRFNDETKARIGETIPTIITVFDDRSYSLTYKIEPVSALILKVMGKDKGSGVPNKNKIGSITKSQVKQIAEKKMPDLNAASLEAAMRIVEGSARSMGVDVK